MITAEKAMASRNLERRKHPRFEVDFPAEYWKIYIPKSRPCRTRDISEGGVQLYLPEKIPLGEKLGVKIFFGPDLESKSIKALGQVVWIDSHSGKKDYSHRIGLRFLDITAENMKELKNFLNAQINLSPLAGLNIPPILSPPLGILEMNRSETSPRDDEPAQEGKRKPSQQQEKETFSAVAVCKEEEATILPPDLIHDYQEDYSDEQRQFLCRKILDMGFLERQRLAIFGNREARNLLIRDPNKMIALNVLKNARIKESEILQYVQRRDLAQDIILAIAQDEKWRKSYPIKFALVSNPKTPLSVSITFVSHLHERELKLLSRDKNVSSVLARRALEILNKRSEN